MNSLFRSAPRDKRDRGFESASLQLRVCELSVPLETKSIRDLPRYGPSLRPPTKINARAVAGSGHLVGTINPAHLQTNLAGARAVTAGARLSNVSVPPAP